MFTFKDNILSKEVVYDFNIVSILSLFVNQYIISSILELLTLSLYCP